jgi:type I restriction enzyme S subunit
MINELPQDWKWVKLGEVCKIQTGKYDANHSKESGKYRFYTCAYEFLYCETNRFKGESIILPGNGANVGEVFYYNGEFDAYQRTYVLNEINTDSKFLYYHLKGFWKRKNQDKQFGSATNYIRMGNFTDYEFPLPPLPTQQAIVAKIEELFSELDKGIEQLKTAQQQIKTYRQAVLKWAFEGKLTSLNHDSFDLVDEYDLNTNNQGNPDNHTNHRSDKSALPKGWKWVKLKEIAKDISDGDHQAPPKSNTGVPFITISNVNKENNKINFSDTFSVSEEYFKKLKINRKPLKGDVLYTVTGSFGIPILIDFEKDFCFQRHIGLVRPLETTNQKWLYYLLQSPDVFNQAKSTATGTAQKTVALNSLRNFEVPYCKIEEQHQIVQAIESRLSVADKLEESIAQSLQQSEALRQSILKKAFEGRLV